MKKLLKTISLLLIFCFIELNVFSQSCLYDEGPPPPQTSGTYNSADGQYVPPIGTWRVLVVFVELDYTGSTQDDPADPDPIPGWPAGQLPVWKDQLFDPFPPGGAATGLMTRYFQQASYNQFQLLGDYLLPPTNNGVIKLLVTSLTGNWNQDISNAITAAMPSFVTGHGLNNAAFFDNWTQSSPYTPKTFSPESPHLYDHVMIIFRNRNGYVGGNGNAHPGALGTPFLGFEANTWSQFGVGGGVPIMIMRHEFCHLMFGSNNFHTGGEWAYAPDYWVPLEGGYGMMSLYGSSLQTFSGWDRQRFGWVPPGNVNPLSARDATNSFEVDGDLDPLNSAQAGIYYLRDFVNSGDVLRIKIPYTDPVNEYPEYLWIENHTGSALNQSEFDKFQFEGDPCVSGVIPGLFLNMQIDREVRQSSNSGDLSGGYGMYYRPIPANGFWDLEWDPVTEPWWCVAGWTTEPFIRNPNKSNAFTGTGDLDGAQLDINNDLHTDHGELKTCGVQETGPGTFLKAAFPFGHPRQIFTYAGNKRIGLDSNPSSASMMNLVSYNYPPLLGAKNLRKIYLNGISVEILNQYANGDCKVQVRFDDVDINQDVRWCADEIQLNPVATSTGYSLNIKSNKTVSLDQGLTPSRVDLPISFNNENIFASPTLFRCIPNTWLNMESNSTLIVDNGSTLKLENQSKITMDAGSIILVKHNSKLILESGSLLQLNAGARVIIEDGSTIEYFPNATIEINGVNSSLQIAGLLDIKDNAVFTFTYSSILHGYVLFNSPQPLPLNIHAGVGCNIELIGTNKLRKVLEVNQEGLYPPSNLVTFLVNNGTIVLHPATRILPLGWQTYVNIDKVRLTSNTLGIYNGHLGLQMVGQYHSITNSTFEYGKYGIHYVATLGRHDFSAAYCVFKSCRIGLYTEDYGARLDHCNFLNNTANGWSTGIMSRPSTTIDGVVGGTIAGTNAQGIYYWGNNASTLTLRNPNITFNGTSGLWVQRAAAIPACGTISHNSNEGIIVGNGSTLKMNNGANVTCIDNAITILLFGASQLDLYKGNNDLTPRVPQTQTAVTGTTTLAGPIIADLNKWNNSSNLTSVDYSINGGAVLMTDATPLTSVPLCGQAVINPNPAPGGANDPLSNCDDCDIINTEDFNNEKLNEATLVAIEKGRENTPVNYIDAVNLYTQILMEDYLNPTNKEKYLLNLNYTNMMDALGNAFQSGQLIASQNNIDPTTQQVINVLNKLINIAEVSNNYASRFIYNLDKAAIYRLADRRDLSLLTLGSINNWVSVNDAEELLKITCVYQIEEDALLGIISTENLFYSIENCLTPQNLRQASFGLTTVGTEAETVEIYPSPAANEINIVTNISKGEILVTNLYGQIVYEGSLNYEAIINVQVYPKGIYSVEISNNETGSKKVNKIVVQ